MQNLIALSVLVSLVACSAFEGPPGPAGVPGFNGRDGSDGAKGVDGSDGEAASAEFADQLASVAALKNNFVVVQCSSPTDLTNAYFGSGTVTKDGHVLTAAHVMTNPGYDQCLVFYVDSATAATELGTRPAGQTYVTDGRDIAYVGVTYLAGRQPVGVPTHRKTFAIGEPLILVSHPEVLNSQQYTFGHVTDVNVSEFDAKWPNAITTDILSSAGSSGGGVFDANGSLVGILVGGFSDGFGLSIVLPI